MNKKPTIKRIREYAEVLIARKDISDFRDVLDYMEQRPVVYGRLTDVQEILIDELEKSRYNKTTNK